MIDSNDDFGIAKAGLEFLLPLCQVGAYPYREGA